MKKLFGIFSLLVLTLSNVLPAYTYADTGENVGTIAENMDTAIENSEIENIPNINEEFRNSGSSIDTELIGQVDGDANNTLSGGLNNEESETTDNQEGAISENISESFMSLFGDNGGEEQNAGTNTNTIRETRLTTGTDFAYKIKKLADQNITKYNDTDYTIKHIKRAEEDNSNGKTTAILSMEGSEYPVKAWFENENGEGEIYYYTEADTIYLNPDSSNMFAYFNTLLSVDLTQFDSTNVENLSYMFYYDASIQSLDFSKFKTPNLTNFGSIIRYSTSIKEIDLSNFDTSHVTNMNNLFEGCTSLETVNIDKWDFRGGSSMRDLGYGIFENNTNLKNVSAKGWKNLPNNMSRAGYYFFSDAISGSLDVTNWETSNITDVSSLFYGLKKLTEIKGVETWNTTNVTDMNHMFQNVEKVKYLNLSGLVTERVTNLKELFENCYELEKVDGLNTWNTENVTSIGGMFRETNIKTVNLDNWDLRNLRGSSSINFADGGSSMFYNANNLTGISARNWKVPEDLYNWTNIWNIKNTPLEVLDVSNWETSNVTKMNFMFTDLSSQVNIIGLDTWDTRNATTMAGMFTRSTGIKTLDLSNFDTSKVTNMNSMFNGASNLKTIYASDKFVVNNGTYSTDMFKEAESLVGGSGTTYDSNNITGAYAVIDDNYHSGYFTNILDREYNIYYDIDTQYLIGNLNNNEKYTPRNGTVQKRAVMPGYELEYWYESGHNEPFLITESTRGDKILYPKWKAIEEKAQETTSENVVYGNETTVTIGDDIHEEIIDNSSTINLVSKEVESNEVKAEDDKTTVQESEIKVSSDNKIEYQGGLEVYIEKTENNETKRLTGTALFGAPIAIKIPVTSNAESVKVQVKHYGEQFGFKGLTTNSVNECDYNGEAVNDKYNGEPISVTNINGEKYALIYTCSASTFVAYTENKKPVEPSPAAGGGRTINTTKQETKVVEQEHNSADTEKANEQESNKIVNQTTNTPTIEEKVKKIEGKSLTRGEVAVMTNILLEVYPQLVEGKTELDDVTRACTSYADEQNFTKDEKKAITRLCKLSIMGIHKDTKEPLDEFLAKQKATNGEFATVMDRVVSNYTEKDLSVVKDALKKLEGDEENVVFGTVYDVFMSIKNIFN